MTSNASACSICNDRDHITTKCPELRPDLGNGFYKPAGGMSHGGDDDDEKTRGLNVVLIPISRNGLRNRVSRFLSESGSRSNLLL